MRNQEDGEAFDAYLAALRNLAETCNFCTCPAMSDSLLRDRIVLGIKNEEARKGYFSNESSTWRNALTFVQPRKAPQPTCRQLEESTMKSIRSAQGQMIHTKRAINRENLLSPHLKGKTPSLESSNANSAYNLTFWRKSFVPWGVKGARKWITGKVLSSVPWKRKCAQ